MFRKNKDRLLTLEVVIDAIMELLSKRKILTREEVQIEILSRAGNRDRLKRRCQIYELPRHRGIKIYGYAVLGEEETDERGNVLIFNHVDGMFSHCHVEGKPEKVVHLSATTPLVKYKDGYRLEEE